jgi:hypothetical protein
MADAVKTPLRMTAREFVLSMAVMAGAEDRAPKQPRLMVTGYSYATLRL